MEVNQTFGKLMKQILNVITVSLKIVSESISN